MSHLEDPVLAQAPQQAAPVQPVTGAPPEIYGAVAEFGDERELLRAVRELRERGYDRLEAYTPFPVHGLDEALGLRRSRLGWIALATGLAGASAGLGLQWWTGTVAYPLVIGGKPLFAFEFAVPVTFELTVLFASFGVVLGLLALSGLPRFYHPVFNHPRFRGATDDRFLLAIEAEGDGFDGEAALEALRRAGGRHAEVVQA